MEIGKNSQNGNFIFCQILFDFWGNLSLFFTNNFSFLVILFWKESADNDYQEFERDRDLDAERARAHGAQKLSTPNFP